MTIPRAPRRLPIRGADALALGLAAGLLAMPLLTSGRPVHRGLTYAGLELVVLVGVVVGWLAADRLAMAHVGVRTTVVLVSAAIGGALVAAHLPAFPWPGSGRTVVLVVAPAIVASMIVRGARPRRHGPATFVALAALVSWLAYDIARLPSDPLRDLHLYLRAAVEASAGQAPYLDAALSPTQGSVDPPFVYPPFVIPVFGVLAVLPTRLVEVGWVLAGLASVIASLRLLGVGGRWLVLMLAWPPLAIGISVGNVAVFTFLLFVIGYRVGAALVVSGALKPQSAVPALWLVRERRWRSLVVGVGVVLLAGLVTLPFVGTDWWFDWISALGHFQETTEQFPAMKGFSLARWFPPPVLIAAGVAAIVVAALRGGRNGLARFGVASVVASPTLYIHGLAPILPGALTLRPTILWFVLGSGPWIGAGVSAWIAIAIVAAALLTAKSDDLAVPSDPAGTEDDIHPAGSARTVWPEANPWG